MLAVGDVKLPLRGAPRMRSDDQDFSTGELVRHLRQAQTTEPIVPPVGSLGQRIVQFCLAIVLAGVFLTAACWGLSLLSTAARTSSWPSVEGTITHSSLQRAGKGSIVVVKYRYAVNNINYEGDRLVAVGDSGFLLRSQQEVSDQFAESSRAPVYYDPREPSSSVLIPGVPGGQWLYSVIFGAMSIGFGFAAWGCFRAAIGKPLPQRNPNSAEKSFGQRFGAIVGGGMILMLVVVFEGIGVLTLLPHLWRLPWGLEKVFGFVMGLIFAAIFGGLGWLGFKIIASACRPSPQPEDLKLDPAAPQYTDNSLVCLFDALGTTVAVIVDGDAGVIHFKNCHSLPGFISKNVPWFSAPLSDVVSVSQATFKGQTTLTIVTTTGKATITALSNFHDLQAVLKSVLETNSRGDKGPSGRAIIDATPAPIPAFGRVSFCMLGAIVGLICGFASSPLSARSDGLLVLRGFLGVLIGGGGVYGLVLVKDRAVKAQLGSHFGFSIGGGFVGWLLYLMLKMWIAPNLVLGLLLTSLGAVIGLSIARNKS